jgi:hypothetical protein
MAGKETDADDLRPDRLMASAKMVEWRKWLNDEVEQVKTEIERLRAEVTALKQDRDRYADMSRADKISRAAARLELEERRHADGDDAKYLAAIAYRAAKADQERAEARAEVERLKTTLREWRDAVRREVEGPVAEVAPDGGVPWSLGRALDELCAKYDAENPAKERENDMTVSELRAKVELLKAVVDEQRAAIAKSEDVAVQWMNEVKRVRGLLIEREQDLAAERKKHGEILPHAERAIRALRSMNSPEALSFTNAIAAYDARLTGEKREPNP